MKRSIPVLAMALGLVLAGCEPPKPTALSAPVGTWEYRTQPGGEHFWRIDIKEDGHFKRVEGFTIPSTGKDMLTRENEGIWEMATTTRNDLSWWQRLWWQPDVTERLLAARTGLKPRPPRPFNVGMISLSYWVPAKADLSVGATVVDKEGGSLLPRKSPSSIPGQMGRKRPVRPASAEEQWLVRETAIFTVRVDETTGEIRLSDGSRGYRKLP